MNQIEIRNTEGINDTKVCFFKNINKVDKPLTRLGKKIREILDEYLEEKSTRQNSSYINSIPTAATNGKQLRSTSFPEASIF